MTQEEIRKKWESIDRREDKLANELASLRANCSHPNVIEKYGNNTGNYDPSADSYWIEYFCPDCRKNGVKINKYYINGHWSIFLRHMPIIPEEK